MLLHSDRLNGIMLDQVFSKLEARGYRFVTLAEALKDPAYQTADNYTGPYGYPWPHRWAITSAKIPISRTPLTHRNGLLDQYEKATRK